MNTPVRKAKKAVPEGRPAAAKKPPAPASPITVTLTARDPAWLEETRQAFAEADAFVKQARVEALAVLGVITGRVFTAEQFETVRKHLKDHPLSPQGVLALVLMAEARGRTDRAREAGGGRHNNAIDWARKKWAALPVAQRENGKSDFARKVSIELEAEFTTVAGAPLRVNWETIARKWLKGL